MQRLGPLTMMSIGEALGAVILWLAAFPTRGWLTGNLIGLADVSVGLFKVESQGQVHDAPTGDNPWLTTIILESLGGFFAVVSLGNLVVAVLKSNRTFMLVFMCTAFLSGNLKFGCE
ncbi:hypothetical protein Btru_041473 [Bulinus truncatus]|nr:hypothetical protein Btru_041473 [Bulinus truncatus]